MAQYIEKEKVVYLIKEKRDAAISRQKSLEDIGDESILNEMIALNLNKILEAIDGLEVKEVDLEQEIQQHINNCLDIKFPTTDIKMIAKDVEHTARKFFELGLKAQKGE